jgi:hypothetical protein
VKLDRAPTRELELKVVVHHVASASRHDDECPRAARTCSRAPPAYTPSFFFASATPSAQGGSALEVVRTHDARPRPR